MNSITITDSIRSIPRDQWDAVAEDSILAGYAWLLTTEESFLKQVTPRYFVFKESGRISGAAVCYLVPKGVQMISSDDLLFGRLKKFVNLLGISSLPVMVCGPLKPDGKHILLEKSLAPLEKERIVEKLLDAVEKDARKRKVSLQFRRIFDQEEILIKQLQKRKYYQTTDYPMTYIDITWNSFDGYKKYIQNQCPNMKGHIVTEINRNQKAGVIIEKVTNLNGQEEYLYDLINRNYLKHNNRPLPFGPNFLSRLKKNFGDDLVIYRSVKKGKVSGVVVMLRNKNIGHFPLVGIDHDLAKDDFTYFNICFYRPIADAITENFKRIYYGTGPYYPKLRRGCNVMKGYFFYKSFHPFTKWLARFWFFFHNFWYQKKLPQPQKAVED